MAKKGSLKIIDLYVLHLITVILLFGWHSSKLIYALIPFKVIRLNEHYSSIAIYSSILIKTAKTVGLFSRPWQIGTNVTLAIIQQLFWKWRKTENSWHHSWCACLCTRNIVANKLGNRSTRVACLDETVSLTDIDMMPVLWLISEEYP